MENTRENTEASGKSSKIPAREGLSSAAPGRECASAAAPGPEEDALAQKLLHLALEASAQAYIPYSHFPVGAAVLDNLGHFYSGCNIENASYGAAICAERCAIVKAISSGARAIQALALVTPRAEGCARPCGICRQVMAEFAAPDFRLYCAAPDGSFRRFTLDELLPFAFDPHSLGEVHES